MATSLEYFHFPFRACNARFHEDFLAGRFIFKTFHYNARIAHLDHEFEVQIQFFSEPPQSESPARIDNFAVFKARYCKSKTKETNPGRFQ